MKRTVKVLAIALLGMSLAVACNNNAEPVEEEPIIDTLVEEPVVEEPVVEEPVVEEPVKKDTPKKTETVVKADASKVTINTDKGSATFGASGASVNTKNGETKADASKVTINTDKGSASFGKGGMEIKKN